VETGDIIFTHPGEIRQWDVLNIDSGYALIFEEEFLLTFFNDRNFLQNLSYFNLERNSVILKPEAGLYERILYLMQNIKTEIDHYQEKDKHILRALLYEVLTLLHRAYNSFSVTQNQNRHIQKFIRLVDNNFSKQHNVGYYADKLCLTPNYLNDIIKASIGVNAKVCIRNKIMNEAKKLLLYTSLSITEISEQLGYKETSYFIRFFKKHTRLTPLQYRLQKP
jgi:AraC-like DNA-binding protein